MSPRKNAPANYGVQADQVAATTIAVGERARAETTIHGTLNRDAIAAAVAELRRQLELQTLPPASRHAAEQHLQTVEGEIARPQPRQGILTTALKGLTAIVTGAGDLAHEVASLTKPIKRIAELVGLAAAIVGLSP